MNKFSLKKMSVGALLTVMTLCGTPAYAFSVDFTDIPVADAIQALGMKAERNVVVNGNLNGKVTMHIADADFHTTLDAIAAVHNLSYEDDGDIVIVSESKTIKSTEFFHLRFLEPETFKTMMAQSIENSSDVVVNSELHGVSVVASRNQLNRIRELISRIDIPTKQVGIEAEVIELTAGKSRTMGINFSHDGWSKDTSSGVLNGFTFNLNASHEEALSNGKVLARPNVITMDGHKATISMGDKVPVFTSTGTESNSTTSVSVEYKDVGVNLTVTPRINDIENGLVTLEINPSVSTITQWVESRNNKAPQISDRTVNTVVRVKSGQTILIGGLLKHDEIKNIKSFLPFFDKIPIIGELFKTRSIEKSDTELVIAITPKIVVDKDGIPQVELQSVKPDLHQELNRMHNEKVVNNVYHKADEQKKAVQNEQQKEEDRLSELLSEYRKLRYEKLKEERIKELGVNDKEQQEIGVKADNNKEQKLSE